MGWFSCLRRRGSKDAPPLQPHQGSMERWTEESGNEDDIQAVKSWREKKNSVPLPSPTSSCTTLVVYDSSNQRKPSSIKDEANDARKESVSGSPSLPLTSPTNIVVDDKYMITAIPPLDPNTAETTNIHRHDSSYHHSSLVEFTAPPVVEHSQQEQQKLRYNPSIGNHSSGPGLANRSNGLYDDTKQENNHQLHAQNRDHTSPTRYGVGGFPTLSPQEEKWRIEQQSYMLSKSQDDFVSSSSSSSSNSTIEDPILVRKWNDEDGSRNNVNSNNIDDGTAASGPIDLDEWGDEVINTIEETNSNRDRSSNQTYNQIDNDEADILSSSFLSSHSSKRPGPDETDIDRPVASYHSLKNNPKSVVGSSSIHMSTNTNGQNRNELVLNQEESQLSSSSILRDKDPDLYSINNSAESEELNAMNVVIDGKGSDAKVPKIPSPAKSRISSSMLIRSSRSGQSSPTLHLTASQESSPSMHSGSRKSGQSIKLSPSRRDSPSVHDPSSYIAASQYECDRNNSYNNIHIDPEKEHYHGPVLVSPSSDGSPSIEPHTTTIAASTTSLTLEICRGRSAYIEQPPRVNAHPTEVVTIPNTAQQRRKARSQSRGRRIREKARSLLSSYNAREKFDSNNLPTSDQPQNEEIPQIILRGETYRDVESIGLNALPQAMSNDDNTSPLLRDSALPNGFPIESAGVTATSSLYSGRSFSNLPIGDAHVIAETIPSGMDQSDRLSDIPSEVDPMLRERYLKACRILKSSLLEKDATMRPSDKEFLSQLLLETTPSNDDSNNDAILTEETVKLYESTVHNTLLERSTPLFDAATTVVSTTYDFPQTNIDDGYASNATTAVTNSLRRATSDRGGNHAIHTTASGDSSSGMTAQELHIHNNTMNPPTESYHVKEQQLHSASTTASQVSSSVFSRVDDDYPYKVLSFDESRHSKVLSPWMMNALRGFFPLEISTHNFCLQYQLDRNTDINHEDNMNLMALLSKLQHETFTMLCVETVDGYVFGAFCSSPWEIQSSWYGSGDASFLWRLKHPRHGGRINDNRSGDKMDDRNLNEIEIYPYTRYDTYVQYCSNQTLAVGGGTDWTLTKEGYSPYHRPTTSDDQHEPNNDEPMATGIGFLLDGDLMGGETNSCVTYANPQLGKHNNGTNDSDGASEFDIQILEVYTFTQSSLPVPHK